jgi:hypothetical protein
MTFRHIEKSSDLRRQQQSSSALPESASHRTRSESAIERSIHYNASGDNVTLNLKLAFHAR